MKQQILPTVNIPDPDEVLEHFEFKYKASDEGNVTKQVSLSFEGFNTQDILDNLLTFLNDVGFSYIGKIIIKSKDGKKTWTT
tara:strand:+ start:2759 stop:3004 length:246 start_codon:yes stop_codon:yes gene_type:complete